MENNINLSVATIFKYPSDAVEESSFQIEDTLKHQIKTYLNDKIEGVIEIAIGNDFVSRFHDNVLEASDKSTVTQALYDRENNVYIISYLPVEIQTKKDLDIDFIPFNSQLIESFSNISTSVEIAAFGFGLGEENKLADLFSVDFDCMFLVSDLIDNKSDLSTTGINDKELYLLPFFTLSTFYSAYNGQQNVIEKFALWLRTFRATIEIFDLINFKYKIIRGFAKWVTSPIQPSDIPLLHSFDELQGLYEEVHTPNIIEASTHLPVKMDVYSEPSTGVICSFVNWMGDTGVKISKTFYPISLDDVCKLDELQDSLKLSSSDFQYSYHELDDLSEKLLEQSLQAQLSNNQLIDKPEDT